ncbi:MAG TPA: TetR/AcrR family transcriptional regulator [Corynebacteriales bacterium]|nr:TetR/AcrR family transcriptional regulator [Mycobacteriales bacterium]
MTSSNRVSRADRREAILEAARSHFVVNGYHGTGMDDVAATLGLSKPILYQYFSSKHELYLAVLEMAAEHLEDLITRTLSKDLSNKDMVRETVETFFGFVSDDSQYYRLLFDSDMLDDADAAERVDNAIQGLVQKVAELIASDTGMSPNYSVMLANLVIGASEFSAKAWLSQQRNTTEEVPLEDAAALTWQTVWRGLRSIPAQDN